MIAPEHMMVKRFFGCRAALLRRRQHHRALRLLHTGLDLEGDREDFHLLAARYRRDAMRPTAGGIDLE